MAWVLSMVERSTSGCNLQMGFPCKMTFQPKNGLPWLTYNLYTYMYIYIVYVYAYLRVLNIFSKHDPNNTELWRPSVMLWQWVGCQPHREVLMCVAGASGGIFDAQPTIPFLMYEAIIQWTNLNHNEFRATRTVSIGSRFNPRLLIFFFETIFFLTFCFGRGTLGIGVGWRAMTVIFHVEIGSKYASARPVWCSSLIDVCNKVMWGELWCKNKHTIYLV